ncbi:hypothetical protein C1Y63_03095 [Corynebacterium sp. 13CS0277]|uniref:hypothetical protein n=1 Tax=Corynebacterium sp. 13CS0277 TaxID=2071994 RepID=UPI000D02FB92|nr:hypothetical protein [Corynebacterium sp. 13CS0277]PRQ12069.1 hypothetical protein C1Y63_03095 [Corynebacterium sp. 13CS0277]
MIDPAVLAELNAFVEEFTDDMTTFATGAYLTEEEKDAWDAPYEVDAIVEVKRTLAALVDAASELSTPAGAPAVSRLVGSTIDQLGRINAVFGDAVIEPEEEAELTEFFARVAGALELDASDIANLPTFEQSDPYDDEMTIDIL